MNTKTCEMVIRSDSKELLKWLKIQWLNGWLKILEMVENTKKKIIQKRIQKRT